MKKTIITVLLALFMTCRILGPCAYAENIGSYSKGSDIGWIQFYTSDSQILSCTLYSGALPDGIKMYFNEESLYLSGVPESVGSYIAEFAVSTEAKMLYTSVSLTITDAPLAVTTPDQNIKSKESCFKLRSDISFGDSMEDVQFKEKTLKLSLETKNSLTYVGDIGGYAGKAEFFFSNDKLTDLLYSYTWKTSKQANEIFNTIANSCIRQYGAKLSERPETAYLMYEIQGKALDIAIEELAIPQMLGESYDIVDCSEWIVERENGDYVKIEIISYSTVPDSYKVLMSYRTLAEEEFKSIIGEKSEESLAKIIEEDSAF